MTEKEIHFETIQAACSKIMETMKAKNADYTGGTTDPFSNFTRVENMGIASTEQGFLTRMLDKFCRLNSFCKNGTLQVKDESVEDTLLDLAGYSFLFLSYLKSKKRKENDELAKIESIKSTRD